MSFTFNFTKQQLKEMIPKNPYVDQWFEAIYEILPEYEITTPQRVAAFHIPVEEASEYLQTFEGAVQSACFFWEQNKLNQWADAGDILTLTKRINGGTIGLEDRIKHYEHALHIFGAH